MAMQADAKGPNRSKHNGEAKKTLHREIRRAWKQKGEILPYKRYAGWGDLQEREKDREYDFLECLP